MEDHQAHDSSCEFQNWGEVEQSIDQTIAASPVPFDLATISNMRDLLRAIRTRCPVPVVANKGYWSTICISWKDVEVEICDDHYELYRFPTVEFSGHMTEE